MPKIDSGPTDGPPRGQLTTVWVTLTLSEAAELLVALQEWSSEHDGVLESGWHTHITDSDGIELTIAIE